MHKEASERLIETRPSRAEVTYLGKRQFSSRRKKKTRGIGQCLRGN